MISSLRSRPAKSTGFDPDEIRRIVQDAKDRGLVRGGDEARPIEKEGEEAAKLGGVRSQWMEIDPDTASRWLENNFRNRPISDDVVKAYAWDMSNDSWVSTHQGIAFNDKDELIDGQHRLRAIILSKKTVRIMVTFGLASAIVGSEMTTMDAVDRGRTRSVSDQLKIQHGFTKNGSQIAAVATQLATLCAQERTRRLSVGQTLEIYRAFEPALEWLFKNRATSNGFRKAGVQAGFAFVMSIEEHEAAAKVMFQDLTAMKDPEWNTGIYHLREFLLSPDATLLNRGTDRALAELVMQAIHLTLSGKKIDTLVPCLEGVTRFRELQRDLVAKIKALFALPASK